MFDFVKLAYEWHSGMFSALYKFACNGGTIFDYRHANELENEINSCIDSAGHSVEGLEKLEAFRDYVTNKENWKA